MDDPDERLARSRQVLQDGGHLLQRVTSIDALLIPDDELRRAVDGVEAMRLVLLARSPVDLTWVWPVLGCAALLGASRWALRRRRASAQTD